MRPSTEARVGIFGVLVLQLLTSVAGVVLLSRMSPAVEQILMENVYSTEAIEDMLATLAVHGGRAPFEAALDRARNNITEPQERTLIDQVDQLQRPTFAGDERASDQMVGVLRELAEVNRRSMKEADRSARRLGLAGAWAMALLGFLSFLGSLVIQRRVESHLLTPIIEADAVLEAARRGQAHRRAHASGGSIEGRRLMANLNWLLDRRTAVSCEPVEDTALREALVGLLDQNTATPVVMGDANGELIVSNAAALELHAPSASELARLIPDQGAVAGWVVSHLSERVWMATRTPTEE